MEPTTRECPLCHSQGDAEMAFQGTYDHDRSHLTFVRQFFRCRSPKCRAVFFFDELIHQEEDPDWQDEREREATEMASRRVAMTDRDVYQTMVRAREENDESITKDRDLVKQVKEIDNAIAQEQVVFDAFMERMRNFAWDDPEAVEEWTSRNWLPPNFAEKSLDTTFGMSRPTLRKDLPEEERALLLQGDEPNFHEGETVQHQVWGRGKVLEGNMDGGTIITVEFPEVGTKRMDLRFAKLKRVS